MERLAFGERIADLQLSMVVQANDVTRNGFFARHTLVGHEGKRVRELHLTACALMNDLTAG